MNRRDKLSKKCRIFLNIKNGVQIETIVFILIYFSIFFIFYFLKKLIYAFQNTVFLPLSMKIERYEVFGMNNINIHVYHKFAYEMKTLMINAISLGIRCDYFLLYILRANLF